MQALFTSTSAVKSMPDKLLKSMNNYRFLVFLRFFIAIVGGYAFTAVVISLISLLLPISKQDAVLFSVSISILIYAITFIYVFSINSLKTVWISILLSTGLGMLVIALLKDWI